MVTKASNEHAHWIPSVAYIGDAASGRHTAVIDLVVLTAACADAENCLYASPRYVNMDMKMIKYPVPNNSPDNEGMAGWIEGYEVQPSQNNDAMTL
jgi:hypothetical protein